MATTTARTTVVRGSRFTWTITLAGSGSIAGYTFTANVRRLGYLSELLSNVALAITDATNRIVTLTLTEAQTAALVGNAANPTDEIAHVADVLQDNGGSLTTYGPLVFGVRTAA